MPFKTAHVLSDSHGYYDLMRTLLLDAEIIDENNQWVAPEWVKLIHLGDTVDRGPQSPETFNLIRDLQKQRPGQVTRLMGNHEFGYCGGPTFYGADEPDVEKLAPLMIEDGKSGALEFAHALKAGDKEWLLVHAGLDPRWQNVFENEDGEIASVWDIADYINKVGLDFFNVRNPNWWYDSSLSEEEKAAQELLSAEAKIITGISYVRGGRDTVAGVTWCDVMDELVPISDSIKVNQIVGHRSHDEITQYPDGKLVAVNVHYGLAQMLNIDLATGEMTTSELIEATHD